MPSPCQLQGSEKGTNTTRPAGLLSSPHGSLQIAGARSARTRAGIAGRAVEGGAGLGARVADAVSRVLAPAVERVVQPQPVTHLQGRAERHQLMSELAWHCKCKKKFR